MTEKEAAESIKAVRGVNRHRDRSWYARVTRTEGGKTTWQTKLFSDAEYGGARQSHRAAVAWVRAIEKVLPDRTNLGGRRGERLPPGYTRWTTTKRRRADGGESPILVVSVKTSKGVFVNSRRSLDKMTEATARRQLRAWAKDKCRLIEAGKL